MRFSQSIRGAANLDWGMQNRLSRILRPRHRPHGHAGVRPRILPGTTSASERIDLNIAPLAEYADAVMCTRGALRTSVPPATRAGLVLRASGGPSILKDLSDEYTAMAMADAVRINADAVAVQVFVGGEHESRSIRNLTTLVDEGYAAGIPVLGVTLSAKSTSATPATWASHPHHRGARRPARQDLLLRRGFRRCGRGLPPFR